MVIVSEQDSYVWKGHDPLTVKADGLKFAAGFQPTCVVQLQPPVMCTAMTVNDDWQLSVHSAVYAQHSFLRVYTYIVPKKRPLIIFRITPSKTT